jgi:hypothetical protein
MVIPPPGHEVERAILPDFSHHFPYGHFLAIGSFAILGGFLVEILAFRGGVPFALQRAPLQKYHRSHTVPIVNGRPFNPQDHPCQLFRNHTPHILSNNPLI